MGALNQAGDFMQFPSMRVDNQIAFVTGAGSGIGQAIAIALAHAGADVAITELPGKEMAAQATAKEIEAVGRRALVLMLDLAVLPMIQVVVRQTVAHFGCIDILVNNAGTIVAKPAVDLTEDDWDKVLDVNLKGTFFLSQAIAKQAMIPQARGKIVSIASTVGIVGYELRSAYCASKAGVINLTRVLAIEWAKHHINVNAVGPTAIYTQLTAWQFDDPVIRARVESRIPLGRIGKTEDVVGAVVYLASPASDLVTGHTLLVDGGWTAI
jgi:2-deoxy-D-gluconate 3-dehydrogenase